MKVIDLFAGAGGFSEGARMAGAKVIWAANHWDLAVRYHAKNHPETEHVQQDLQQADFRDAPPHDGMLASPACQGHSAARGKEKPHHDAQRSTAFAVVTCAEVHRPQFVAIENVRGFASWCLYPAWCHAMHLLGYALAPMILDAADHGVPQERKRLIIVATRSKHPIVLDLPRRPHVAASNVIDFNAGNWSRVADKVPNTQARWARGRAEQGDRFVMPYYGSGSGETGRSLDRPIGTLTTKARWAVVDGDRMRMVNAHTEGRAFMGFRPDYELPANEAQAWHLMGNAVVPQKAADVIDAIRRAA